MSVVTDLYTTLNNNAGVRALVGISSSPQESRIYPEGEVSETAVLPHIAYFTVARPPFSTLKGVNDLHSHAVQIACHATTHAGAQALADAVHDALEGNGYQDNRFDFYDERTKAHTTNVEWSFLA